ncbi:MAG: hypothetical protein WCK39_10330 [Methanomassiliicoccales archaeon]
MRNTDLSAQPEETSAATRDPGHFYPLRYHRRSDASVFPVQITAGLIHLDEGAFIICTVRLMDRTSTGESSRR